MGSDQDEREEATRDAVREADAANGEPDATDQAPPTDSDSPGEAIARDEEPPEPGEPT